MEFTLKTKSAKDNRVKTKKRVVGDDYNLSKYNDTFCKFFPSWFSAYAILDSKGEVLFSKGQF